METKTEVASFYPSHGSLVFSISSQLLSPCLCETALHTNIKGTSQGKGGEQKHSLE